MAVNIDRSLWQAFRRYRAVCDQDKPVSIRRREGLNEPPAAIGKVQGASLSIVVSAQQVLVSVKWWQVCRDVFQRAAMDDVATMQDRRMVADRRIPSLRHKVVHIPGSLLKPDDVVMKPVVVGRDENIWQVSNQDIRRGICQRRVFIEKLVPSPCDGRRIIWITHIVLGRRRLSIQDLLRDFEPAGKMNSPVVECFEGHRRARQRYTPLGRRIAPRSDWA